MRLSGRAGLASQLSIAVILGSFAALGGCTNHDPEFDRVGGPLPADAEAPDVAADAPIGDGGCVLPPKNAPGAEFPCDVNAILGHPIPPNDYSPKCRRCHQDPPKNGAPFPLLTWANTQEIYALKPIWQRMANAIKTDYMPFCADQQCGVTFDPPVDPLTAQEKATLLNWLECPMPVFGANCSDP